jgi:hypothetical protein
MTITIDRLDSSPHGGVNVGNLFFRGENAGPQPSARTSGALFQAMPNARLITLVTTVVVSALGTTSARGVPDLTPLKNITIVLTGIPMATCTEETARERYERLRRAIAESGIPMLGDKELLEEIASRKGNRDQ